MVMKFSSMYISGEEGKDRYIPASQRSAGCSHESCFLSCCPWILGTNAHMLLRVPAHVHMLEYVRAHTQVHMHTHTGTRAHTHTHSYVRAPSLTIPMSSPFSRSAADPPLLLRNTMTVTPVCVLVDGLTQHRCRHVKKGHAPSFSVLGCGYQETIKLAKVPLSDFGRKVCYIFEVQTRQGLKHLLLCPQNKHGL